VRGYEDADDCTAYASDGCTDSGSDSFATKKPILFPGRSENAGSSGCAHSGSDGSAAQAMFVIDELHAVNILSLNRLFSGCLSDRDSSVGDAEEGSGEFLFGGVNDLNLLSGAERA
jgi:hypothetical protein